MPEITAFGWFHTIIGIIALITGVRSLIKFKIIEWQHGSSKIFLVCTFLAATSALGIYHQTGSFNPAHALAILTLLALAAGRTAETTNLFRQFSKYVQAISYSATFLFHMIPAITDGLMRLPTDNPVVTDIQDPLLRSFYLAFLIMYLMLITLQIWWIRKQSD